MRSATIPAATHLELFNPVGPAPVLVLCDHAGREVPAELERLGLSEDMLARHIGWDIGAADLTRELARLLDAPALLNHMSRLVIDPNRRPGTPTSIPEVSDGCVVPGNQDLTLEVQVDRVLRWFLPYHRAVARRVAAFRRAGIAPAIIAIHSFTPRMNGEDRPWQVGVLWRGDRRLAGPILDALEARGDLIVGNNQPYSGLREFGFTVQFHAQRTRLPHVMFEIRQNEIATTEDAIRYARIVHESLREPLRDPSLYTPYEGDNLDRGGGLISWRHAMGASPLT